MGRSAKIHKRAPKKAAPSSAVQPKPAAPSAAPVQSAKKRTGLKSKAKARSGARDGHVLGGADYVALMLGGRRRAAEEALRLPGSDD